MKPSANLVESLKHMNAVQTTGQVRLIASQMLLAIARKEVPATDAIAAAKLLSAISQSMDSEVKLHVASVMLRDKGAHIAKVASFGQTLIDGAMTQ